MDMETDVPGGKVMEQGTQSEDLSLGRMPTAGGKERAAAAGDADWHIHRLLFDDWSASVGVFRAYRGRTGLVVVDMLGVSAEVWLVGLLWVAGKGLCQSGLKALNIRLHINLDSLAACFGQRAIATLSALSTGLGRFGQLAYLTAKSLKHMDGFCLHLETLGLLTAKLISRGHPIKRQHMELLILWNLLHRTVVFLRQSTDLTERANEHKMNLNRYVFLEEAEISYHLLLPLCSCLCCADDADISCFSNWILGHRFPQDKMRGGGREERGGGGGGGGGGKGSDRKSKSM
ncbi:hypothetical protein EYF80_013394 [Liparis tanakae]|uniref:Uncharacterized protein n=1 Tax=Liparis tanakae TaxID=230148 RepID=A0A4Z2IFF2_9TELE|nr:hypothetical protein EYF80_013394 [Liparis tanakae]